MFSAPIFGAIILLSAVAVTSLWREVLLIEARVGLAGIRAIDGPEIGTLAPAPLRADDAVYLFLSDHCPACHEVVARLEAAPAAVSVRAVRVADDDAEGPSILATLPRSLPALDDQLGRRVSRELAIRATPLGIAVRGGFIAAKGYVRGPEDIADIGRPLTAAVSKRAR